jgi:thiol-disulfide isomerase/thioredoxin
MFSPRSKTVSFQSDTGLMSRFRTATSNVNWSYVFIVLFVVVLSVAAYFMFNKQIKAMFAPGYRANSEHVPVTSGGGSPVELIIFTAQWCPICTSAKPEWSQVVAEYQDKTINGRTVIFTEVDCTTETPDVEKMINQYKVEGFPTVILLKDGQVINYDAKVTKATLVQFLNTAV